MPVTKTQWKQFHQLLADELGLTPRQVGTLRCLSLGDKKTPEEIAAWLSVKKQQPPRHTGQSHTGRRDRSKTHYQAMIDFSQSCSSAQWSSLLRDYGE